jgi:hypothetical protein
VETGSQEISAQYTGLTSNVYFYDSSSGLHDTYATIASAVADFSGLSGSGMIYVTGGSYAENVTLNPSLTGANPTGLVFLDYYPTEAAKYDAGEFDPYNSSNWVQLDGSITINDLSNFTLLGFNITSTNAVAAVNINNQNSGSGTLNLSYLDVVNNGNGNGIQVQNHTGTVNVSNVKASSSSESNSGAAIGSSNPVAGKVNITNSAFNQSTHIGLFVQSNSLAVLTGVTAVGNGNHGAFLQTSGVVVKNSVFSENGDGSSGYGEYGFFYTQNGVGNLTVENAQFNNNYSAGIYAKPVYGHVSLKNVRADSNGNTGVSVDTCDEMGGVCQNIYNGNVTITSSSMEGNGHRSAGSGLYINSAKGSVTLTSVWVGGNGDSDTDAWGAYISNLNSYTKSPVTITDSNFDGNFNNGLTVYSLGLITLKDVSASSNSGASYGARIDNDQSDATAGIRILNSSGRTNNFNNNVAANAGLLINSRGAIAVNSVYAYNTSGASGSRRGVEINNLNSTSSAGVTVKLGGFDGNAGGGLYVFSTGAITVNMTDCSASSNSGTDARGIYLDNDAASSARAVILDGGNYHDNNSYGIQILSLGAVTVKNVEVYGSISASGARLSNNAGTNAPITVTTSRSGWTNAFNGNSGYGLHILSNGNVLVNNTNSNNNNEHGFYITTSGKITLNRTNAEQNNNTGAYLNNAVSGVTNSVTLTNANFNYNSLTTDNGYGLHALTFGAVSLKNVLVNFNGDGDTNASGASIDNRTESGSGIGKPVSIIGSQFYGNVGDGLTVFSAGVLKITNLDASSNVGNGASINNYLSNSNRTPVTITNAWFNENGGLQGLYLESYGNVTLKNVEANKNTSGDGIYIEMLQGTPPETTGNVKYSCGSSRCSLSENFDEGLHINTRGTITLTNLNLSDNGSGAYLVNNSVPDTLVKNVTISNCDFNNSTDAFGLYVNSKGLIKLTNVNAGDNQSYGATLDNTASPKDLAVTLAGTGDWDWFGGNGTFGLLISTNGKVSTSKINASENQTYGLRVDNTSSASGQAVYINYADISRNWHIAGSDRYGLFVNSTGMMTLKNVWAVENGDSSGNIGVSANARLNNETSASNAGVSLTNVYFNNAYGQDTFVGDGLSISSHGNVTVTNIQASENTGYGADINNQNAGNVPGITIKGSKNINSLFNNNGVNGIHILSFGTVSISYVNASSNSDDNASISNASDDSLAKLVNINNSIFNGSGSDGLMLLADAAVTLLNVESSANTGSGIYVRNNYWGNYNVALTNIHVIANRNGNGLELVSSGAVTARNLAAFANNNHGMLFGSSGAEIGNFTLTGINYFSGNGQNGIQIESIGNIYLTQITAEKNGFSGVSAASQAGVGTLTVNKLYANYNGRYGLIGNANNTIKVNTIHALNNGTAGSYDGINLVQNSTIAATSVLNSVAQGNTGSGIEIDIDIAGGALQPIITNTTYFGNDVDDTGDPEVFIH